MLSRRSFGSAVGMMGLATTFPFSRVSAKKSSSGISEELLKYDAVGLAQLVQKGQLTPVELIDATLKRIEALDGKINAMTTLSLERARVSAESIDKNTPLAGVPTLLKDLIDVEGIRRTNGSRLTPSNIPLKSPDYVHALEQSGLNIIGMTNTPEFASLAITDNHAFGPTLNPWNLDHTPGGSSGGSAAAVSAGYVPIAHGTDGGGSNRIPASCCGLLGMKASRYRMACGESDGIHQFMRTHQSLSRSVRDSAVLFAATENRLPNNPYKCIGLVSRPGTKRLKIAFSTENCFGHQPSATVKAAVLETALLCEQLGHHVVEVRNPLEGEPLFEAIEAVMLDGMPQLLNTVETLTGWSAEKSELLTPMMVQTGRYAMSLPEGSYQRGMEYLNALTKSMGGFYGKYDLWVTPTIPIEPPRSGYISPDSNFLETQNTSRDLLSHTAFANAIGAPSMSVPLAWSSETGLPIGVHFSASPGNDKLLYEMAYAFEEAMPWKNRWAPNSAYNLEIQNG